MLLAGVPIRSLGHADGEDVVDAQIGQDRQHLGQLSRPAVDQQQVGALDRLARFLVLDHLAEAPAHDLAHHAVVVAGGQVFAADVELAVLVLPEALGAGDDHAADRIGALDMGVVVDLDPLGPGVQTKDFADLIEDLRRGRVLGQLAAQGLLRIGQGVVDQPQLLAPLRPGDLDLAPRLQGEGFFQQFQFVRPHIGQDQARDRLVLVELAEEGGQNLGIGVRLVDAREISAVAPVLAGAEEEDLNTGQPAFGMQGHDVSLGVAHALGVQARFHGDGRQGADAVAHPGGVLELHVVRGRLHLFRQAGDDGARLAAQEGLGLVHQVAVVLQADQAGAGRRAALDLMQHAGPGARLVDAVRTGAQQKGLLQGVQRPVDRPGRGEGAEIGPRRGVRPAVLTHLRRAVVAPDHDLGEGLVVLQQDVEAGLQPLDVAGLKDQGLGLGGGDHQLHRPGQRHHQTDALGSGPANQNHAADHQGDPGDAAQAQGLFRHAQGAEMVERQAEQQLPGDHHGDGGGHPQTRHAPGGGNDEGAAVEAAHPRPPGQGLHRRYIGARLHSQSQQAQRHRADGEGDEGGVQRRSDRWDQPGVGRPLQGRGGARQQQGHKDEDRNLHGPSLPVRISGRAAEDFGQPVAGGAGRVLGQGVEGEPADLGDLAVAGALGHVEGVDGEDQDVIAGKEALVGMDRDQTRLAFGDQPGLFAQFADHGGLGRLAPVHPAAGQPPAVQIGVLDQQHPPLAIDRHAAHAQRHAPPHPRDGEEDGPGDGLDSGAPVHRSVPSSPFCCFIFFRDHSRTGTVRTRKVTIAAPMWWVNRHAMNPHHRSQRGQTIQGGDEKPEGEGLDSGAPGGHGVTIGCGGAA
uniref:PE-PGRS family protein n=1 Tax=Parastrongyloides trichosuri TaxID=131310 RepID=A0A0N5A6X5_PARTI